jgi:hypothetical protein
MGDKLNCCLSLISLSLLPRLTMVVVAFACSCSQDPSVRRTNTFEFLILCSALIKLIAAYDQMIQTPHTTGQDPGRRSPFQLALGSYVPVQYILGGLIQIGAFG